jgi:hypothetical protein
MSDAQRLLPASAMHSEHDTRGVVWQPFYRLTANDGRRRRRNNCLRVRQIQQSEMDVSTRDLQGFTRPGTGYGNCAILTDESNMTRPVCDLCVVTEAFTSTPQIVETACTGPLAVQLLALLRVSCERTNARTPAGDTEVRSTGHRGIAVGGLLSLDVDFTSDRFIDVA